MTMAMLWAKIDTQGRGQGKTTALAAAAKKMGALLVVRDAFTAKRVSEQHHVETVAVAFLEEATQGRDNPIIFDTDAVVRLALGYDRMLYEASVKIKKLSTENAELKNKLLDLQEQLAPAQASDVEKQHDLGETK